MIDVDKIVVALHDLVDDALTDVQVLDGWNRSDDLQPKVVAVGIPPVQNTPAVTVDIATNEGGIVADQYDVTVHCSAAVWDGDEEFTKKRAAAQQIIADVAGAVDDDRDLDGTVFEVSLSPEMQWYQLSDDKGTLVQVDFTLVVRVYA